jgi:hypothetical protein
MHAGSADGTPTYKAATLAVAASGSELAKGQTASGGIDEKLFAAEKYPLRAITP